MIEGDPARTVRPLPASLEVPAMRITRFRVFLLLGASLLVLGPAIGLGQPGNFPGGPPPGGFGQTPGGQGGFQGRQGRQGRQGGFRLDPSMIFNMLSGGKDYLSETDYLANPMVTARDPNAKDHIEAFMQRNGITNGQLTRDQFAQFFEERRTERQAERAAQNPDSTQAPDAPGATTDPNADPGDEPVIEDKRPTVYRATNLPKGLPTWFAQLDMDKDGQVGLYEWKQGGRSQSEFQSWDLNGDGFITVEEAMRVAKTMPGAAVASGAPTTGPGAPSFGQFQGGTPQGSDSQGNGNFGSRRRGNRNRGNFQNQGAGGY